MSGFPVVPPPADGLAEAFRSAASRRRRSAAGAGGAGLLSVALVLGALTGTSGQVLTQEPAPPADRTTVVRDRETVVIDAADERDEPQTGSEVLTLSPAGPAARGARPAGPVAPGPAAPAAREARADPPAADPAPSYRAAPMTRTGRTYTVPLVGCLSGDDLCSSVRTDAAHLYVSLCNQGVEPARLDFDALDEVDVEVRAQGKAPVLWRWAVGRPRVPDPHQVRLGVNGCLEWRTPWRATDQAGRPLPPGGYDLRARIDSRDAGAAATADGSHYRS